LEFFELRNGFELTMFEAKHVHSEVTMGTFHCVEHRRAELGPQTEAGGRLSPGHSVIVIAGLSALSWAVLIAGALGIRELL
jgi:hypothetical protein